MTIGIAATGPRSGLAVFRALRAVERVAGGAIGGFVSLAAISNDGSLLRAATQRGGTETLFTSGNACGVEPPPEIAEAHIAGLMSSGPDRPEPLSQFVPADPSGVLVTGHRLPNTLGASGRIINVEILERLLSGDSAQQAVDSVLDANPESDAGIIAVDMKRVVYARNSDRVQRRPDLGHARRQAIGARTEVLHNAITPGPAIAQLAADVALEVMLNAGQADGCITVHAGTPLEFGPRDTVLVDRDLKAIRVITSDRRLLSGRQSCAAIYMHALVRQDERELGIIITEPYTIVEDGRIVTLNGQSQLRLEYRHLNQS